MNVIVCIDEVGGMMFHGKRVSRDIEVLKNMIDMIGNDQLHMNEYSMKLFHDNEMYQNIQSFQLMDDGYYFIEDERVNNYLSSAKKLIIYCWNRKYPSDVKLDMEVVNKSFQLIRQEDIVGKSHDLITKSVFVNKEYK